MRRVLAVSGPIASGKSGFNSALCARFPVRHVSTRDLIRTKCKASNERGDLQAAGAELDKATDGRWVADEIAAMEATLGDDAVVLIDSVRVKKQIEHLRSKYGATFSHVHITASDEVLRSRFNGRKQNATAVVESDYDMAKSDPIEAAVDGLGEIADVKVVTNRLDAVQVALHVAESLKLFPGAIAPLVDVIVGAQYGSEGKGNVCDYLASEYDVLVRVGGPNAGHKIASPEYSFVHLPSGSYGNASAQILIGAGATLNVDQLLKEIDDLNLTPDRVVIDGRAIVIESSDIEHEQLLADKIGSTKKGVGVATARKILGRDGAKHYGSTVRLAESVPELQAYIGSVRVELEKAFSLGKRVLLEGTQGTGLSIHHGLYPKVTSRDTTASGCLADAGIAPRRVHRVYLVTRTYPIRVGGDSGEMGTVIDCKTIAERSGLSVEEIERTEVGTVSGKPRRIAEFDLAQVCAASLINGATDVVLTFVDYLGSENRGKKAIEALTDSARSRIEEIERDTGVSVTLLSTGFGRQFMLDRRQK